MVWGADLGMAEPGQTAPVKRVRELNREGCFSGKDLGQRWRVGQSGEITIY